MSTPFSNLSEFNHTQIRKYLTFFRNKRQSSLRALSSEFADLRHDRSDQQFIVHLNYSTCKIHFLSN